MCKVVLILDKKGRFSVRENEYKYIIRSASLMWNASLARAAIIM